VQAADLSAAGYTLHSLRRFAAKGRLDSGLNIRQVQVLLGHQDLQTTTIHLNHDLDELQRERRSRNLRPHARATSQTHCPKKRFVTQSGHLSFSDYDW
jgi:integrase